MDINDKKDGKTVQIAMAIRRQNDTAPANPAPSVHPKSGRSYGAQIVAEQVCTLAVTISAKGIHIYAVGIGIHNQGDPVTALISV